MPLCRVFIYYAAICARYGHEPAGPSFVERAWLRAKRKYLQEHGGE